MSGVSKKLIISNCVEVSDGAASEKVQEGKEEEEEKEDQQEEQEAGSGRGVLIMAQVLDGAIQQLPTKAPFAEEAGVCRGCRGNGRCRLRSQPLRSVDRLALALPAGATEDRGTSLAVQAAKARLGEVTRLVTSRKEMASGRIPGQIGWSMNPAGIETMLGNREGTHLMHASLGGKGSPYQGGNVVLSSEACVRSS